MIVRRAARIYRQAKYRLQALAAGDGCIPAS
jgi:hypothetical protein